MNEENYAKFSMRQIHTHRKNLVQICRLTVKTLIDKASITDIDDDSEELINFCAAIEQILTYRQKAQRTWYGIEEVRPFWDFIQTACRYLPNNCINGIATLENVKSHIGKGRAWIRCVLMEKRLSEYLCHAIQQTKLARRFYQEGSVMLSEDINLLCEVLLGLNSIDFSFCLKGHNQELKSPLFIDYTPYLMFQQSQESMNRDYEEELANLNIDTPQLFPPSVTEENSWQVKYKDLERSHKTIKEQKGYLEELLRMRENQLQDLQRKHQKLLSLFKKFDDDSKKDRHQMENVVIELQQQLGVFYCSLLYISRLSSDEASKKMNLDLFRRYSEEEAIKHDKFNMASNIAEFVMLDDITEVSDDLLENSWTSLNSKYDVVSVKYDSLVTKLKSGFIALEEVNPDRSSSFEDIESSNQTSYNRGDIPESASKLVVPGTKTSHIEMKPESESMLAMAGSFSSQRSSEDTSSIHNNTKKTEDNSEEAIITNFPGKEEQSDTSNTSSEFSSENNKALNTSTERQSGENSLKSEDDGSSLKQSTDSTDDPKNKELATNDDKNGQYLATEIKHSSEPDTMQTSSSSEPGTSSPELLHLSADNGNSSEPGEDNCPSSPEILQPTGDDNSNNSEPEQEKSTSSGMLHTDEENSTCSDTSGLEDQYDMVADDVSKSNGGENDTATG